MGAASLDLPLAIVNLISEDSLEFTIAKIDMFYTSGTILTKKGFFLSASKKLHRTICKAL